MQSPLALVIAGTGGQEHRYRKLIDELDVADRVHLVGRVSESEKFVWYARALAVAFVPKDEDYGYIAPEAMLAAKPVITCTDSGGPLDFVLHEETGLAHI